MVNNDENTPANFNWKKKASSLINVVTPVLRAIQAMLKYTSRS
jgi:hypothetical protein